MVDHLAFLNERLVFHQQALELMKTSLENILLDTNYDENFKEICHTHVRYYENRELYYLHQIELLDKTTT